MQNQNYTLLLSDLRTADSGSSAELITRFGALTIAFVFVAWWQQDLNILYGYFFYVLLQSIYIRGLVKHSGAGTRAKYLYFLFQAAISLGVFNLGVAYLWLCQDPICQFGAVMLLIGQIVFSMSRHVKVRDLLILTGAAACLTSLAIAIFVGQQLETSAALWGTILISLLFSAYLGATLRELYVENQKHLASQAARAREERLRTIGQMTAGVAHDFNNIMTAAMGHLELFTYASDPEEQRAHVLAARQSANRAVDLTLQLMAYSRKAPLERELRDFLPMIDDVVRDHEAIYGSLARKALDLCLSPELVEMEPFWVDGNRMQSAIANLLRNSAEAIGPDGSMQLSATIETVVDDTTLRFGEVLRKGRYIAISVTDNGSGIPVEDLDHVTEPFWSTKGPANGSGLGLAMVVGFAEQSGGRFEISSKPGKGTVATLRLPYVPGLSLTMPV